jgi:hypothetical protein
VSAENTYTTNIQKWVYDCLYFLTNQFMICKHLIQLKGIIDAKFFHTIYQNYNYPFIWKNTNKISYKTSSIVRITAILENNTNLIKEI